jgi:CRISPR system Cascade subunit CasB
MITPNTQPARKTGRDDAFVRHLQQLVKDDDRAALADLRRGLGKSPGEAAEMHRHVVPFLAPDANFRDEEPYYLVASLFALHQGMWQRQERRQTTNLGASFERLAGARDSGADSVERRFVALLNCGREELPYHLRQAVSLLKAGEVPVDWLRLLRDVRGWDSDARWVQRSWARAYWRSSPEEQPATGEEVE